MQPANMNSQQQNLDSPSSAHEDNDVCVASSPRARPILPMPTQTLMKPKSLCRFIVNNNFTNSSDGRHHDAYSEDVWGSKKSYSTDRVLPMPPRFGDPRRPTSMMATSTMKDTRFEHREMPLHQTQRSQVHEYRASAAMDDMHQRRFQKLVCPPQFRPPNPHRVHSTYQLSDLQKLNELQRLNELHKLNELQKLHELRKLNELQKLMKYYPTSSSSSNSMYPQEMQNRYESRGTTRSDSAEKRINVSFSEDNEARCAPQQYNSRPDEDDNQFDPALVLASMASQKPVMKEVKTVLHVEAAMSRPLYMPPMNPTPSSFSPPAVTSDPQWICDRCNAAICTSYEEAYLHELSCPARILRSVTYDGTSKKRSFSNDESDEKIPKRTKNTPMESSTSEDMKIKDMEDEKRWFSGYSVVRIPIPSGATDQLPDASLPVTCLECLELFSIEDVKQYYQACTVQNNNETVTRLQVGIRCLFCKSLPYAERGNGAVLFPSTKSEIHELMKQMVQTHVSDCEHVPDTVHRQIRPLKNSSSWTNAIMESCMDSVKALGMEETPFGLRFCRPLPTRIDSNVLTTSSPAEKRILFPKDKNLVDPYVYMLLEQVEVCYYTEADSNLARSKGPIGFPGIQCRHCHGHAGIGKYFPATPEALTLNSVSQNLYSHLIKCKWCPQEIKDGMNFCKEQKGLREFSRPPPGWRKDFFLTLWGRLHGN